ncbi:XRE family transcriptional regulator [Enterobacter hormaechei]|uniref:XRE family transcriptional regulator n=1 Tax=Enterobacter hormaechei TaxID=158836 RepID=UPI0022388BF3|nr:S24 family peptidase [Enterobacter hormaechei]MCW4804859.1 helix-turn-helix domain-containing protein [Enterobacter hormaechei subsp. xiangfangensis]
MTELIVHASAPIIELMVQEERARQDFSKRLALACEKAGFQIHGRQAKIAKKMKLTPKAVSKWFNGEAIPRRGKLQDLAALLGTSVTYLLGDSSEDGIIKRQANMSSDVYRVDVLDLSVSAGPGNYMLSDYVEVLYAIEFTTEHARSLFGNRPQQDVKVMTVSGDSMAPTLVSGDRLFVDISVRHFQTDGVYSFVYGRTFHVKRLQMQGDKLAVLSDNPAYEKWYINEENQDQLYVMGKALIHESIKYNRL